MSRNTYRSHGSDAEREIGPLSSIPLRSGVVLLRRGPPLLLGRGDQVSCNDEHFHSKIDFKEKSFLFALPCAEERPRQRPA